MKLKITLIILLSIFASGCSKDQSKQFIQAEIIGFDSHKCGCCWGWIIKLDENCIKATELPKSELIGHEIKAPIPVIIEIGEKIIDCSYSLDKNYDYYDITSLEFTE